MSSYMSNLTVVGNLGRDPEMRFTPSGQAVTNFSVAVNRQYTTGNGQVVKDVVWFRVSAWGKLAEICNQYLRKGSKVLVEGRLDYAPETGGPKTWTGNDGVTHADFGLVAQVVRFLSAKDGNGGGEATFAAEVAGGPEEDIPF